MKKKQDESSYRGYDFVPAKGLFRRHRRSTCSNDQIRDPDQIWLCLGKEIR